jgi:hypothetical protein
VKSLAVPAPLRARLNDSGADSLMDMFADAHAIATDSVERRLREEMSAVRLDIANLRFELLKWSFVFWITQLAATAGMMGFLIRAMSAMK